MGSMVLVPVFDGNNYENWSLQMKTLFKIYDLWDVVETGTQQEPLQVPSPSYVFEGVSYDASSSAAAAENYSILWKQWMEWKDVNALSIIQSGLSIEVFFMDSLCYIIKRSMGPFNGEIGRWSYISS